MNDTTTAPDGSYWWFDHLFADSDLNTPDGRAECAHAAVRFMAEHRVDPLVADQYVMTLADRCRLDPGRLRRHFADLMNATPSP